MTPEEIVAKALCFEEIEHDKAEVAWPAWKHLAEVAFTALSDAGFAIVERQPAEDILKRAAKENKEALNALITQAENDLKSAHEAICRLQGIDPAKYAWPEWSPQANSLRWYERFRREYGLQATP